MSGEWDEEIKSVWDEINRGRPDEAVRMLDAMVAEGRNADKVVPMLAQILRDNARDVRLLARCLSDLSIEPVDCGSYDHLEYRFRRRVASERVFQEITTYAFSRHEASAYVLIIADDLITAGRIDEAEALLGRIGPTSYKGPNDYLLASFALAERKLEAYVGIWEYLRGRIALARNEIGIAFEAFTSAVRNEPQFHTARVLAGQLSRKLGMGAKACDLFDLEFMMEMDVYRGW